jgi:hypothetical protein
MVIEKAQRASTARRFVGIAMSRIAMPNEGTAAASGREVGYGGK